MRLRRYKILKSYPGPSTTGSCYCVYIQLTEHKGRCEEALKAKDLPLEVVLECLSLREQRVSIDLVRDDVEAELHKV